MEKETKRMINKVADTGDAIINMDTDEIKQILKNPLTKSRYESAIKRKIRKPRPSIHEQIICDVCKVAYTQSNVTHHRQSKHHIFCDDINKKFLTLIYD